MSISFILFFMQIYDLWKFRFFSVWSVAFKLQQRKVFNILFFLNVLLMEKLEGSFSFDSVTKQNKQQKNLKVPTSEKVTWPNFKLCFFALDVCFIAATDPQSRLLFALMQQDKTVLKPLLLSNLFIIFVAIKKREEHFSTETLQRHLQTDVCFSFLFWRLFLSRT